MDLLFQISKISFPVMTSLGMHYVFPTAITRFRFSFKPTRSFNTSEELSLLTLTVRARAKYNGTTFKCLMNGGHGERSEIAQLNIQGA